MLLAIYKNLVNLVNPLIVFDSEIKGSVELIADSVGHVTALKDKLILGSLTWIKLINLGGSVLSTSNDEALRFN
ncbi:hypothetical protein VNO78_04459 [Psophocarpus tetragonolobus]|uniref:Uncharacterized protein n=1 Tax=Psophocarpus tetragonolobus TaxID=3891 RepID=A0AAN9TEW4_PSOTE